MIAALAWRAAPYLAVLAAVALFAAAIYHKAYSAGADTERNAAMARDAARQLAEQAAIAKRHRENALTQERHAKANLESAIAHEHADRAIDLENARLRADLRRSGGLRIPAPASCGGLASQAETPADGQPAASTAATIALPDQITDDLLAFAAEADKVVEQARAMQQRLVEDAGER